MPEHVASSAELSAVCQRLAAHYTALAGKESTRGVVGYARLDKERVQYLRLLESSLGYGLWQEVKCLVEAIRVYLDRQGWWIEKLAAVEMQLTSARKIGDRKDEGWLLNNLGYTCERCGEYNKALAWYEQSLPIHRELGDKEGEGTTLNNIAAIYYRQGNRRLALQTYQQGLAIHRKGGDKKREGETLNNIGMVYWAQGKYEQALQYFEQCLPIALEFEHKIILEGAILNNIGLIYRAQGNPDKALEYYQQALVTRRQLGDRDGEAKTCWNIALAYEDLGDLAKTEQHISFAVQIAELIGHPSLKKWREKLAKLRNKQHGLHDQ